MIPCLCLLRRFASDRRGTALTDLAFALPVLVLVLTGCFEVTRYVLLHQKLDRVVSSMADLVAQQDGISEAQLDDLFDAASHLMEPYELAVNGRVVVSSVYTPDENSATVVWQRLSPGSKTVASEVGDEDDVAELPSGLLVRPGENVIVAEVFYDYQPFFLSDLFGVSRLYHSAYNRPRIRNLTTVMSSN